MPESGFGQSTRLNSCEYCIKGGAVFTAFLLFIRGSLLEGELGLVGLFGDGGGEGLFLGGTAEEENYFFQHGKTP